MLKTICNTCKQILYRPPSKIEKRNYCSRDCYAIVRNQELVKRGKPFRINSEISKRLSKKRIKALKQKTTGTKHYAWKADKVSYRGLHYWLRRKLGKPVICADCGKKSKKPRIIQWANVDGKYRRAITDYIALCCSCHKLKDLSMKSIQDSRIASL